MKAEPGSIVKLSSPKGYFKVIRQLETERVRQGWPRGTPDTRWTVEQTVVKMVMHLDGRVCGKTRERTVRVIQATQVIDDQWINIAIEDSIKQWENVRKLIHGQILPRASRRRQ